MNALFFQFFVIYKKYYKFKLYNEQNNTKKRQNISF